MLCAKCKYDIDVIMNKCVRVYDLNSNRRYIFFMNSRGGQRCSVKRVVLEILQKSQGNTCVRVSFLINLQGSTCNLIKKQTLAQVFPCEFCKISKNTYFYRTPVPNFEKGEIRKKMSSSRNLKSSCHGYLPGGAYYVSCQKKTCKNKIWLWGLNFKCSSWPVLAKQPINV